MSIPLDTIQSKERCGNCRFWKRSIEDELSEENDCVNDDGTYFVGECNRYPPTLLKLRDDDRSDDIRLGDTFAPCTHEWDWCGEFQERAGDGNQDLDWRGWRKPN